MNTLQSILLFILGIALVVYFAEKLVKGTVGISLGFGISTFIISVIFIGFDPENLAVGAVGSYEGASGIALGSIIGATMVAIALAFGLTALIAPMKFEKAPKQILVIPVLAVLLLGVLGLDGQLSRIDGVVLLLGFVLSIIYLIRLSKKGLDIQPTGEVAETLEDAEKLNKWKSLGIFILSLAGVVLGSELLVRSSQSIIAKMGLSETVFGMTILAFLISIEELARELPAAIKGRPEISYGNVIGSILAFFLFNAGIIALVKPITVDADTLKYYLPICLVTTIIVSIFMSTKKVSRLAGAVLVLLYVAFAAVGFIV
ncbi:calcium:sodium antiporter [Dysgonamonadaceae bacterium]|jgi:cation:H+ antiporter|nr:calcium:sodium antiporter [Dysgonamonadaceae bacterium]